MEQRQAKFTFHGNLQDFLPKSQKGKEVNYPFTGKPSVKDAIEAMGIPHVEVGAIFVNSKSVTFQEPLVKDASVEVYPVTTSTSSLQPVLPQPVRFVLDVHLGKLARYLRLLGFDTLFESDYTDHQLATLSLAEQRMVLTRDVGLLKQKAIQWGYWLRSQNPEEQLREVLQRFQLSGPFQPFTRCLECNHSLAPVAKESVKELLPPKTKLFFDEFYQCSGCQKVYWKGSHYERMEAFVQKISNGLIQ